MEVDGRRMRRVRRVCERRARVLCEGADGAAVMKE